MTFVSPAVPSLPPARTFTATLLAFATSAAWAQAAVPDAATLPEIKVRAEAAPESATSTVSGYRATRSLSGTKTDTPLAETPQSVSVITRDLLDDRAVSSVAETLRYSAGVVPTNFSYGGDVFVIRGFSVGTAGLYLDGLRAFTNVFSSTLEPYGAERVEVVRGPASVLFGQATPGGLVNVVSKRPQADAVNEVGVELGSHDRKQVNADVGGALNERGDLLYRVVFLGRDADTQYDWTRDDRLYAAPSLTWRPDARTQMTLLASYNEDRASYVRGSHYHRVGDIGLASDPQPLQPLPESFNFSGPGTGYHRKMKAVGYQFEHRVDDDLVLRQNLRYSDIETDRREQWASFFSPQLGLMADGRTLVRLAVLRPDADRNLGIDSNVEYKARTGHVAHTLLAGLDLRHNKFSADIRSDMTLRPLDLFAPQWVEPDWSGMTTLLSSNRIDTRSAGLYLQDQARLDANWVVSAGVRRDRVKAVTDATTQGVASHTDESSSDTTGRIGAVYLGAHGWSPYVSYATSFEPTAGVGEGGRRYEPSRGKQLEVGVRYQPADASASLLASVYDLRKTNVLMSITGNPYQVQAGEVRSRGLELEGSYLLTRGWNLLANYAFTETETLRGSAADQGKAVSGVPRHVASVWSKARVDAVMDGLGLGGGVRYVGASRSASDAHPNPAGTYVDLAADYRTGPWTLAANVDNVADRKVLTECTATLCTVGYGRALKARATYRW